MKHTLHFLLAATCAATFLAGCGDSGKPEGKSIGKAAQKGAESAVKMTGDAVVDYKAALAALADLTPRIHAYSKADTKLSMLSKADDLAKWGILMGQLHEAWKQAKPAEREELKKHAEVVLEKWEDGDEKNVLLSVILGTHMSTGDE